MSNLETWDKKELEDLIAGWNGEDGKFIHNGELYHEDDVYEARARLKEINNG